MKIEIPFLLPYKLPISLEKSAVSKYENFATFKLTFDRYTKKVSNLTEASLNLPDDENTIVHLEILPELKDENIPEENIDILIKEALYHGLQYVNTFLNSFRLVSGLDHIRNIDMLDLPKFSILKIDGNPYAYARMEELTALDTDMSTEDFGNVMTNLATWHRYPEFGLVDQFYSQAKSSFYQGNFTNSIIQLQTSFEIQIRSTLKMIIINEGKKLNKKDAKIEQELANLENMKNFRNLIEKHLAKHLNTNLDFDSNPVMLEWKNSLYKYRNSIVHAGNNNITLEQAREALDSFLKMQDYLSNLLTQRGYLTPNGNINLNQLRPPVPFNPDMLNQLKKQGILPAELNFKSI